MKNFYPKDNTPGCTKQACGFSERYPQFTEKGAVIIGVSKDSVASHKRFEEKYGLAFTLLADSDKKLADEMRLAMDAKQWVDAIQEYADITELDAATLNRLIKEIVVHEHIDSDKTRHISIEIHFNLKPIPEVEQVTA